MSLIRTSLLVGLALCVSLSRVAPASVCSDALAAAVTDGTPLKLLLKEGTEVEVELLGFNPANMADPRFASQMKSQIEEVERFLNELAADYPDGKCPLCSVHVRPGGIVTLARGQQLLWHGGSKLTVRVPKVPLAGLVVSDNDSLRVKWNLGRMHSTKSIVSQRWMFLNPAGPVRLGLRRTFSRVLDRLNVDTSKILGDGDRGTLHQAARNLILSQVPSPEALSPQAREALAQLDTPEKAEKFLQELKAIAENQELVKQLDGRMEDAVRSVNRDESGEPSTSQAYSLFVGVANAHDIRIHLSVVNGELQTDISSPRQPLKVIATGLLVAVATSDRVEVNVGAERAAGTLAIEQALRRAITP